MTQTTLDTSQGLICLLVKFEQGSSTWYYARYEKDLTVNAQVYTSMPQLSMSMDRPLGIDVEPESVTLSCSISVSPVDVLIQPYPLGDVKVTLYEVEPGNDASLREIFYGSVAKATLRPSGRDGVARLQILGIKARLNVVLGFPATSTCPWVFGDFNCTYPKRDNDISATISALNVSDIQTRIRLTFSGSPDLSNDQYRRGYIEVDGTRITIRESLDNGSNPNPVSDFDLAEVPPPSWDGATCTVVLGCDKSIGHCRHWDNEDRFGGCGYAMPDRNPVFTGGNG